MKRIIISLIVALVAALSIITATATANNGSENGEPETTMVCAGGITFIALDDEVTDAALERGTAWLVFFLNPATGNVLVGLVLENPPEPGVIIVEVREVPLTEGACMSAPASKPVVKQPPPNALYCAVEGNTHPFTGAPIKPGTALNLVVGQPDIDPNYTGATPANFIVGRGLDCSNPPAGFVRQGTAGAADNVSEEPGYPKWGPQG